LIFKELYRYPEKGTANVVNDLTETRGKWKKTQKSAVFGPYF